MLYVCGPLPPVRNGWVALIVTVLACKGSEGGCGEMTGVTVGGEHVELANIPIEDAGLMEAELVVPDGAKGLVVVAHGSGSSRMSPRNRYVAGILRERDLGTLLIDLQTSAEHEAAREHEAQPDSTQAARRILLASEWIQTRSDIQGLPIYFYAAGAGAGAALIAAAYRADIPCAIVTRSGRVELAGSMLRSVSVPTLFIVGAYDLEVLHRNREALDTIAADDKRLEVIPGACHLFEEPGTLAAAALHAANWFVAHLCAAPSMPSQQLTIGATAEPVPESA